MPTLATIRNLDATGRIVLPVSLRESMNIKTNDPLEIFTEGEIVILRRYLPGCIFCNQMTTLKGFKGRKICAKCISDIRRHKV